MTGQFREETRRNSPRDQNGCALRHLLLNYGVQHAVHVSRHALGVAADVDIAALGNNAPQLCSLRRLFTRAWLSEENKGLIAPNQRQDMNKQ